MIEAIRPAQLNSLQHFISHRLHRIDLIMRALFSFVHSQSATSVQKRIFEIKDFTNYIEQHSSEKKLLIRTKKLSDDVRALFATVRHPTQRKMLEDCKRVLSLQKIIGSYLFGRKVLQRYRPPVLLPKTTTVDAPKQEKINVPELKGAILYDPQKIPRSVQQRAEKIQKLVKQLKDNTPEEFNCPIYLECIHIPTFLFHADNTQTHFRHHMEASAMDEFLKSTPNRDPVCPKCRHEGLKELVYIDIDFQKYILSELTKPRK